MHTKYLWDNVLGMGQLQNRKKTWKHNSNVALGEINAKMGVG
jgi:hypothetical protein